MPFTQGAELRREFFARPQMPYLLVRQTGQLRELLPFGQRHQRRHSVGLEIEIMQPCGPKPADTQENGSTWRQNDQFTRPDFHYVVSAHAVTHSFTPSNEAPPQHRRKTPFHSRTKLQLV